MLEHNHHLLKAALKKLPVHSPKDRLWDAIDMELTAGEHDVNLQVAVSGLPQHKAPDSIWSNIEDSLDKDQQSVLEPVSIQESPKRRTQVFSITRWAAAAGIFLTFAAGAWLLKDTFAEREYVTVSYSEEKAVAQFLSVDWEEDEDAFAVVEELCEMNATLCEQEDFRILTDELTALNEARDQLKLAMDQYGNDPELIAQLTAIEHDRTDLLKNIIKRMSSYSYTSI